MRPYALLGLAFTGAIALATTPHTFQGPYQPLSGRGVADGYAPLGSDGLVPSAFLPTSGGVAWGAITGTLSAQTDLQAELDGKEDVGVAAAADAAHVAVADPHTGYQKESEKGAASGYASLDGSTLVPVAQIPALSALSGSVTDGQIPAAIARDSETAAAITAHEAAGDPHPGYLTTAEGNAAYEVVGAVATHVGLADPHTQYQKESEKDAANGYAGLSAGSKIAGTQQTYGIAANTAAEGNDARLSDARTPLAHKTSHENAGTDEVSVLGLSGLLADPQTPLAHDTSHENGGADEISVAGLSGLLADGQTPLAHATSHQSGGSDAIKLDDLATPDDNTDLNASTTRHGLLLKLTGSTAVFLRADGTWAAPTASVSISVAEIDFGTIGVFEKAMTVTDASITAASKIIVSQAGTAATGRQADENELDGITCRALPGTGSFVLNCSCRTLTHGKFNVWYTAS